MGFDQISYSMLRNLPIEGKFWLLNFINLCLNQTEIPTEWNKVVIHPIKKFEK